MQAQHEVTLQLIRKMSREPKLIARIPDDYIDANGIQQRTGDDRCPISFAGGVPRLLIQLETYETFLHGELPGILDDLHTLGMVDRVSQQTHPFGVQFGETLATYTTYGNTLWHLAFGRHSIVVRREPDGESVVRCSVRMPHYTLAKAGIEAVLEWEKTPTPKTVKPAHGKPTGEYDGTQSADSKYQRMLEKMPPLDKDNGKWLGHVAVANEARALKLKTARKPSDDESRKAVVNLKKQRRPKHALIRYRDNSAGIDKSGRHYRWGSPGSQSFWYLKSTIANKPV